MRSSNNYNVSGRERGNVYTRETDRNTGDSISYHQNRLGPLSTRLLTDDPSNPDLLQRRIRIYSAFLLCVSIFFWSWAMYNTQHLRKSNSKALDLGIFSFFGTGMSSLIVLRMAMGGSLLRRKKKDEEEGGLYLGNSRRKSGDVEHVPTGRDVTWVCVDGLLFAMTAGKQIYIYFASYCFIFSILWLLIAYSCWHVLGAYREAIRINFGDELSNKKSKNRFGCVWLCNYILAYCYRRLTAGKLKHDTNTNEDEIIEVEEEDVIDEELRALYAGPGKRGYLNINY